ncbi:MAG: tyrosine-type recombinase/integrase, partial [Planctomycetes bacterium]|nr:tyrosine-type recombinase/integrase [Planctomycetota bacterium]
NRLPNDILTRDEVDKLLALPDINASAGIRDRALLETLYSTGIRLQECTNLEVSDVDYDGGYLRVNQGKGNKDRIVPLGKIACYWLKEYIRRVRPEFLKHNKKDPEHNALWVSHYLGKPLSSQIIAKLVRSYGRKAGINKKVTVHTWRRTLATHLLQAGVNLVYIQEILGHEDMRSLDRYIKVTAIEVKQTHQRTHPRERIAAYEEKKQG